MERIYLDWNVITQIKNPKSEPYISIAKVLKHLKDEVTIPYSSAHMSDLKKGYKEEEPYITYTNQDLLFISKLSRNTHWYYKAEVKDVWTVQRDPLETFESYKDNEISAEQAMDFEKLFEELGMGEIGKHFQDLFKNIQVPFDLSKIPEDSELKKPLQEIFQPTGATTSMLDLMKNFGRFSDEIHKDPTKYKDLRNGFRGALQLPSDISNWKNDTWDRLDSHMPLTMLNKSFTNMVSDAVNQNSKEKGVTFHDEFLHAYTTLDLVGFNPEKLDKKNTYTNFFNDSQHAFFATYCDVFVTNDGNTRAKTKAIYDKYGITTEILSPEEFLTKMNTSMDRIELYTEAVNGLKTDHLILTKIPNLDGSGFDYRIEYIDFVDNERMLVGTTDLDLGNINFVKTGRVGVPFGAMKLLSEWIKTNLE
jgi:hypothetical protein